MGLSRKSQYVRINFLNIIEKILQRQKIHPFMPSIKHKLFLVIRSCTDELIWSGKVFHTHEQQPSSVSGDYIQYIANASPTATAPNSLCTYIYIHKHSRCTRYSTALRWLLSQILKIKLTRIFRTPSFQFNILFVCFFFSSLNKSHEHSSKWIIWWNCFVDAKFMVAYFYFLLYRYKRIPWKYALECILRTMHFFFFGV